MSNFISHEQQQQQSAFSPILFADYPIISFCCLKPFDPVVYGPSVDHPEPRCQLEGKYLKIIVNPILTRRILLLGSRPRRIFYTYKTSLYFLYLTAILGSRSPGSPRAVPNPPPPGCRPDTPRGLKRSLGRILLPPLRTPGARSHWRSCSGGRWSWSARPSRRTSSSSVPDGAVTMVHHMQAVCVYIWSVGLFFGPHLYMAP